LDVRVLNFSDTVSILGAVGFGSIITVVIQFWINSHSEKRKRNFDEKKEAYVGFWGAHLNINRKDIETAMRDFVYWHSRCDMVAPESVREAIKRVVETNKGSADARISAIESLRQAIREDIGISN
jgi:hypothetical protein